MHEIFLISINPEIQVVGGRNGFGAKLCNIFSSQFTVETAHKKKKFKMTWTGNMMEKKSPKIGTLSGEDYTKITFRPDLKRFKVDALSDDMVGLFKKRAYDIAGTTPGLKENRSKMKFFQRSFRRKITQIQS